MSGAADLWLRLGAASMAALVGAVLMAVPTRQIPDVGELGLRRASSGIHFASRDVFLTFHTSSGRLSVRTADGQRRADVFLRIVIDGAERPLTLGRADFRVREKNSFGAMVAVDLPDAKAEVGVDLSFDPLEASLRAELTVRGAESHRFQLRAEIETDRHAVFVPGLGELSDLGEASGAVALLEHPSHPLAILSREGELAIGVVAGDRTARLSVTTSTRAAGRTKAGLRLIVGADARSIWGALHREAGKKAFRVAGGVTPRVRANVYGLRSDGMPVVRVPTDDEGRFEIDAPQEATLWLAAIDASKTSVPTPYTPGTVWPLRLDVAPAGELSLSVVDAETNLPVTARVSIRGIEGTVDPSFGPDYRASGAGPIVDALRGTISTPLPSGRYRVLATRGIEWSVDEANVTIEGGHSTSLRLVLRHVVPTEEWVGCDLHVHARPSFDTPVQPEDRVLSLVAAGIDFAIPTEHNTVGDYHPVLDTLELRRELATVSGVEVTTYSPRIGHFGVFPYPKDRPVPPYRRTTVNAIFNSARRDDPSRVLQVNHPRLGDGIGYFEITGFHPPKLLPGRMRIDFDALEVYSGFDASQPKRVEAVLADWFHLLEQGFHIAATGSSDSHRVLFQWAGYPRTMAHVGREAAGALGGEVSELAVVQAVKRGHSVVTSGPLIEASIGGRGPGEELEASETPLVADVVVRAAPWVDVATMEMIVSGRVVHTVAIPPRPLRTGREPGSLEEVREKTVRWRGTLPVPSRPGTSWAVFLVRGDRPMDDVLPFMPVVPLAFTNPIWIHRDGAGSR